MFDMHLKSCNWVRNGRMFEYVLYFNYVDTKAKCRRVKKLTCKGTLGQVFIRVYRISHVSIFDPAL